MCGVAFKFKFLLMVLLGLGLISTIGMNSYPAEKSHEDIFKEVERIELDFGDVIFASVSKVVPLPNGFVVLISETAYTPRHTLLKFSKAGKLTGKYDQRGNGPGEIRSVGNIVTLEKSILVSESSAPYIHEFSHDLKFLKDHRIKKGGKVLLLGKYIGIWGVSYMREQDKDKAFILELYDRNTFEFRKFAFEIPEVPAYVNEWGGICQVDEDTFAGVYVTQYKIYLFDAEMQFKKSILGEAPRYIKKYYPWEKSPNIADNTSVEWINSWSTIDSIYYIDGKFIVSYIYENKRFLDIVSPAGETLVANYQESKNSSVSFTQGPYIWQLEWNDDNTKHYLVKTTLDLKSRPQ